MAFAVIFFCGFHWITSQGSRGHALEHLESSGSKIMSSEHVLHKLCERKKEIETGSLKMNFKRFFPHTFNVFFGFFCALPAYYPNEGFKACLESFWS